MIANGLEAADAARARLDKHGSGFSISAQHVGLRYECKVLRGLVEGVEAAAAHYAIRVAFDSDAVHTRLEVTGRGPTWADAVDNCVAGVHELLTLLAGVKP